MFSLLEGSYLERFLNVTPDIVNMFTKHIVMLLPHQLAQYEPYGYI